MKTGTKQEVLTSDDVRRMIEKAAARGEEKVDLSGRTIQSIEFSGFDIPMNLDLNGSVIRGNVNIADGKFTGDYIDLDDARVKGKISLNTLGEHGFSLFLRRASVTGANCGGYAVFLVRVSLKWLCIGGLRVGKGVKQLWTTKVLIDNCISFERNAGVHAR
ncbi:MAG: hypothetical protein Q7R85_01025 [bacterium]|nr:hypothetical protein [bacterium]